MISILVVLAFAVYFILTDSSDYKFLKFINGLLGALIGSMILLFVLIIIPEQAILEEVFVKEYEMQVSRIEPGFVLKFGECDFFKDSKGLTVSNKDKATIYFKEAKNLKVEKYKYRYTSKFLRRNFPIITTGFYIVYIPKGFID